MGSLRSKVLAVIGLGCVLPALVAGRALWPDGSEAEGGGNVEEIYYVNDEGELALRGFDSEAIAAEFDACGDDEECGQAVLAALQARTEEIHDRILAVQPEIDARMQTPEYLETQDAWRQCLTDIVGGTIPETPDDYRAEGRAAAEELAEELADLLEQLAAPWAEVNEDGSGKTPPDGLTWDERSALEQQLEDRHLRSAELEQTNRENEAHSVACQHSTGLTHLQATILNEVLANR